MQSKFQIQTIGQEVQVADINSISANAAHADDRVYAELLRPRAADLITGVAKGILPYGAREGESASFANARSTVSSAGIGAVYVAPFRALVGPQGTNPDPSEVRSVSAGYTTLYHAATASNNRWDLVYCRVDIDQPASSVTRYVKAADGTQGVQSLSTHVMTTAVLGIQQGSEGPSPALPVLPADTSTSFYIPLAAIALVHPFNTTDAITNSQIRDLAPVLGLAPIVGGSDVRPAGWTQLTFGAPQPVWNAGSTRPQEFLSPDMTGKVERIFGINFGAGPSIPLGQTSVLDSTIDWRKRVFKTSVQTLASGGGGLAWSPASVSHAVPGAELDGSLVPRGTGYLLFGQSFAPDFGTVPNHVAYLINDTVPAMAAGSSVEIYVDSTTGELKAKVGATSPDCLMFFWLEASAPFSNAS